jgi:hypothetical protein
MAEGVLLPEEVGPADSARVLDFLNGAVDAAALADTIGFSEGASIGRQVAEVILHRRASGGPFRTLEELLALTGVNLARFTEIVVALSAARPAAPGWTMRLMPAATRPWLGQKVRIVGQLMDSSGLGVPGAEISCVASAGILSAPNSRGEMQRGAAVRLTTEPSGIVNLELQPQLTPPLDRDSAAALESELARLGAESDSPAAVATALAGFAARYRAEGSSALREAVDRLFAAYPVDTPGVGSSWPVETVAIMVIVQRGNGRPTLAGTATLVFRNWLGAWLSELAGAVQSDRRLDQALSQIEIGASGTDAAQGLMLATQALAQLEHGVVGGRERDKLAGLSANRYLERLGDTSNPAAIENVVRAAGASKAAISAGGFAVFEAIQSVQSVSDAVGPKRGVDAEALGRFDGRLAQLEANGVTKAALDTVRSDILSRTDLKVADFGGRVAALESDRVTKAQLAGLDASLAAAVKDMRTGLDTAVGRVRSELTVQISGKADQAAVSGLNQSFKTLVDGRLAQLEARALDRAALDSLRADLISQTDSKLAAVNTKVAALESDRVTKAQLAGVETRLTQINSAVGSTRAELLAQINAKADQATVTGLKQSVSTLQTENQRIATQVQGVDFDAVRASHTQRRGPGR